MKEYLIQGTDRDWFDLHSSQYADVLWPNSVPSRAVVGWGDHRIEVLGCEISFSYEDPGIQVTFERGDLPEPVAQGLIEEVLGNIVRATGQSGSVIQIS